MATKQLQVAVVRDTQGKGVTIKFKRSALPVACPPPPTKSCALSSCLSTPSCDSSISNSSSSSHTSTYSDKYNHNYLSEWQLLSPAHINQNALDFMLAESYYDKTGTPVINPFGWLASEKYDGVRAGWSGKHFITRNGTIIQAPADLINKMPPDIQLDGEFFIKRNYFNETSGIIRRHIPDLNVWKPIKYMVFDVLNSHAPLADRVNIIRNVVSQVGDPLVYVTQTVIDSEQHLALLFDNLVSQGAEGVILRNPTSRYVAGRSSQMLKLKVAEDEDCLVCGYEEGENRNQGKLGALIIKWVDPKLIKTKYNLSVYPSCEFKVGSGFKDAERCLMHLAPKIYPLGTVIKVSFNGLQNSGKPRHPAFKGVREQ